MYFEMCKTVMMVRLVSPLLSLSRISNPTTTSTSSFSWHFSSVSQNFKSLFILSGSRLYLDWNFEDTQNTGYQEDIKYGCSQNKC